MRQVTHQAAFATGSVVLVDDPFFSCLIQCSDGSGGGSAGVFSCALSNFGFGILDECARAPDEHTISQAALVTLLDAFDGRFGISQLDPPGTPSLLRHAILLERRQFVQFYLTLISEGGKIPTLGTRPHRLGDQDAALSRLKPQFESGWGQRGLQPKQQIEGLIPSFQILLETEVPFHANLKSFRKLYNNIPLPENLKIYRNIPV